MFVLFSVVLTVALVFMSQKYYRLWKSSQRYKAITDIEAEVERQAAAAAKMRTEAEAYDRKMRSDADSFDRSLRASLSALSKERDRLSVEVGALSDAADLQSAGFYKSKYDFDQSTKYESKLEGIRGQQKALYKDKRAIVCETTWSVGGSAAEGKKMIDRVIKLGLSAFNTQCDNEILKVKFNTVNRAEERIGKIRDTVDKLLEPNQCHITKDFFKLKLEELYLCYEYQEKLHLEKEEQKAIREQMREEEQALKEAEKAQAEAAKEEARYSAALEKAKADLASKSDKDREAFLAKIADLESKFKEAVENKERAKSLAQQTRSGYVYVISNIGSFGENIFKIGMTRRLDPQDRIDELGNASVPFEFDVHAVIHSDDAPSLEHKLHEAFAAKRVNTVNPRKEFFRVELSDIEATCKKIHKSEFKVTLVAEAKEYRQSIAANAAPIRRAA